MAGSSIPHRGFASVSSPYMNSYHPPLSPEPDPVLEHADLGLPARPELQQVEKDMRAIPEASLVRREQLAGDENADVSVEVSRLLHGEPSSLDVPARQLLRVYLLYALRGVRGRNTERSSTLNELQLVSGRK